MQLFVRYVVIPTIISPVLIPWSILVATYIGLRICQKLSGRGIDAVVYTADLLKQHRRNIENLATWSCYRTGLIIQQYNMWVRSTHQQVEDGLDIMAHAVQPICDEILDRSPFLARLLGPALFLVHQASRAFDGLYNFLHDEIVPVALDLAERLPLVHDLLLRHAIRSD